MIETDFVVTETACTHFVRCEEYDNICIYYTNIGLSYNWCKNEGEWILDCENEFWRNWLNEIVGEYHWGQEQNYIIM